METSWELELVRELEVISLRDWARVQAASQSLGAALAALQDSGARPAVARRAALAATAARCLAVALIEYQTTVEQMVFHEAQGQLPFPRR